jgi:hypothetical protein
MWQVVLRMHILTHSRPPYECAHIFKLSDPKLTLNQKLGWLDEFVGWMSDDLEW